MTLHDISLYENNIDGTDGVAYCTIHQFSELLRPRQTRKSEFTVTGVYFVLKICSS